MQRSNFSQVLTYCLLFVGFIGISGCDSGTVNEPVPGAPVLLVPFDKDSEQANATELLWDYLVDADFYQLQVSKTVAFNDLLVDEKELQTNSYPLKDLELDKNHYWRVRAVNDVGFGDWSQAWTFVPSEEAEIPTTPRLAYPGVGAVNLPTQIDFSWNVVDGATGYHIQVSLEPNFIRRSADLERVRETSATVRELVPTYTYFWRVRSQNPLGFSEWSEARRLVVEDDDVEQRDYK